MIEFTIDRAKWRAGATGEYAIGFGDTKLINSSGYMCCLGHMCQQAGFYKDEMMDIGEPEGLKSRSFNIKPGRFEEDKLNILLKDSYDEGPIFLSADKIYNLENSDFSTCAIGINDDAEISNRERERQLRVLAKKYGCRVKFIGKSKPNPKGV